VRGAEPKRPLAKPGSRSTGHTPLHVAAEKGFRAVAELLIENKAEVNARSEAGETPLHLAAAKGNQAIVELLLAKGADPDPASTDGTTPLLLAAGMQAPVVELLLAARSTRTPGTVTAPPRSIWRPGAAAKPKRFRPCSARGRSEPAPKERRHAAPLRCDEW